MNCSAFSSAARPSLRTDSSTAVKLVRSYTRPQRRTSDSTTPGEAKSNGRVDGAIAVADAAQLSTSWEPRRSIGWIRRRSVDSSSKLLSRRPSSRRNLHLFRRQLEARRELGGLERIEQCRIEQRLELVEAELPGARGGQQRADLGVAPDQVGEPRSAFSQVGHQGRGVLAQPVAEVAAQVVELGRGATLGQQELVAAHRGQHRRQSQSRKVPRRAAGGAPRRGPRRAG